MDTFNGFRLPSPKPDWSRRDRTHGALAANERSRPTAIQELMNEAVRRRKLIEVALPLEAINAASAREKSIRHGHPSTLHLWWARRPLAAARAVIFAQMVDDPSSYPDLFPTEKAQEKERQRLFRVLSASVRDATAPVM